MVINLLIASPWQLHHAESEDILPKNLLPDGSAYIPSHLWQLHHRDTKEKAHVASSISPQGFPTICLKIKDFNFNSAGSDFGLGLNNIYSE